MNDEEDQRGSSQPKLKQIQQKEHSIDMEVTQASVRIAIVRNGLPLHPQPTPDPLDPLNWSSTRKNGIMAIVMALYFMFTWITTTTIPTFPILQETYSINADQVNWTVALPSLGLAVGPLIASSLAETIGRRVVFTGGTMIALAATIGAALSPTYGGYMAARLFQGIGVSPAATVGLAIVNDLFFDYQRGFKTGLWVLAVDMGLCIGPLVGGFICLVDQSWTQWLTAILFGVVLGLEVFFLPETLYPRNYMLSRYGDQAPSVGSCTNNIELGDHKITEMADETIKRTRDLEFINMRPIPRIQRLPIWNTAWRFILTWKLVAVSFTLLTFAFGWYWWTLAVVTMMPLAYPTFSPQSSGLLFISFILGTLAAEIFFSGRLSDWVMLKATQKNLGERKPEDRIWLAYPAAVLSAVGITLWGQSVERDFHWIVGQVALFLYSAGIQMSMTLVASYVVDCYPLQSMAVITYYVVVLNFSAFLSPFFIVPWVEAWGYGWTFTTQGIIIMCFAMPALALMQKFGLNLRTKGYSPKWVNPESSLSLYE